MDSLGKAFIEAYGRQGISVGKLMPLSDALELSRKNERGDAVAEQAADENSGVNEPSELRALLQVDGLGWPKVCEKLAKTAGGQIEALADRVASEAGGGRNVIGFVGDCAGSGCTTLLLCVAKHLAEGLRVVVVDANGGNPSIARDLGLLPDVGWKDVAAGRLPLADALIDSVNDGLAVLPYSGHQDVEYGEGFGEGADVVEDLRRLGPHYDLVLADLGVLPASSGDHSLLGCVDAAVIVRSACVAQSDVSRRAGQILHASGVGIVGVVENRYCDSDEEEPDGAYDAA